MSVESSEKKRNILLVVVAVVLIGAGALWYTQWSSDPSAGDAKVQAANERLKKVDETAPPEVKKANEAPPEIQRSPTKGSIPVKK